MIIFGDDRKCSGKKHAYNRATYLNQPRSYLGKTFSLKLNLHIRFVTCLNTLAHVWARACNCVP